MVRIADLPSDQRPRERLLRFGQPALTDAELVAVLLSAGQAGENALAQAHRLLHTVGGVPGLARTRGEQLVRLDGLGPAKAARLLAAFALPERRGPADEVRVARTEDLVPVFRPLLAGLHHERLVVAVCDRRLRVRHTAPIADGASDGAPLPVRDILATVLRHDGHAFAVAHNHPSGDPTPSEPDRAATRRLRAAAETAGLRFLAHLVIAGHEWSSA
ncbi:MAG TPA: JAB domain-containing protein [Pseudonocardiaceae bacterium]